jgi:RNA polymerase sigma-70 factor (ECF subfamily)
MNNSDRTDEQLMCAAAEGDMDAFETLVRRHQDPAVNFATRMLSDPHAAHDAAQEAFLRILEKADRYRPIAKFRTYLFSVLRRICIDHYRKHRPHSSGDLAWEENGGHSPEDALIRDERAAAVRQAIDRLPERQKTALILQHYEEMSYEQVAEVMDCTPRAVDSLLVRARRKLENSLRNLL